MSEGSFTQLWEVFDFFLKKVLDPIDANKMAALSPKLTPEMAKQFSDALNRTISNNCQSEFQDILEEKNVSEKLELLDRLKSSDALQVNMKAFAFTPQDPNMIKEQVIHNAKKAYINKLKYILNDLNTRIDELTPRDVDAIKRARDAQARVESVRQQIHEINYGK